MKTMKSILLIGVMIAATTMSHAQTKHSYPTDTGQHITGYEDLNLPVFTGAEQNLQDSLEAVGAALTDTALKSTVINAVNVIKDVPKDGGLVDWITYVFAGATALFGVYQYISKRLHMSNEKVLNGALVSVSSGLLEEQKQHEFTKAKLNVVASAAKLAAEGLEENINQMQEYAEQKERASKPAKKAAPKERPERKHTPNKISAVYPDTPAE